MSIRGSEEMRAILHMTKTKWSQYNSRGILRSEEDTEAESAIIVPVKRFRCDNNKVTIF